MRGGSGSSATGERPEEAPAPEIAAPAEAPTPGQGSGGSVEEYPEFQSFYTLGYGGYGIVYLVKKIGGTDNGNFYALKELKKEPFLKEKEGRLKKN